MYDYSNLFDTIIFAKGMYFNLCQNYGFTIFKKLLIIPIFVLIRHLTLKTFFFEEKPF